MSSDHFHGKRVVITGAGGGVGSALVKLFAERGASLILCDASREMLSEAKWPTLAFDLTDARAVKDAAAEILRLHGAPDVIISNAGWTRAETLEKLTEQDIDKEVRLNLTGVAAFTNALLPSMVKRGSGVLVYVSSVNALVHFGNPAYAAAKAGINAFSRAVAVEYGRKGIRSNVICPGSIHTPAWDHRFAKDPEVMDKLHSIYPLARIVVADEVAEAVAFLASDRASGITGVVLPVDAGATAGFLPFIDNVLGGG